jgi:hypothetical protein
MEVMNIYSATINTLGRVARRHRRPRIAERRTYAFILVPFDFSKNGRAKKAVVATHLLDNHIDSGGARSEPSPGSPLSIVLIRASSEKTDEEAGERFAHHSKFRALLLPATCRSKRFQSLSINDRRTATRISRQAAHDCPAT